MTFLYSFVEFVCCLLQIFSFNQKVAEDEDGGDDDDDDLSDSNDSVYSGLEDSGSDSDDGEEEEEEGQGSDDDDVKVQSKLDEQVRFIQRGGYNLSPLMHRKMFWSVHRERRRTEGQIKEERKRTMMSMNKTPQMRR